MPTQNPDIITDPSDYSYNATRDAHIHDYWGQLDRLTVVDFAHPGGGAKGTGPGYANGEDIEVRSFQPVSGSVFPQGTAAVEITFSWVDDELDSYTAPTVWMKTANQTSTMKVGAIATGEVVLLNVTAGDADLPHQLLSAWLFELRMSSPEPMPLRFKGAVHLKVDAIRGLDILPFPAHPDAWQGAMELPLLEFSGSLTYFEDVQDYGCNGAECPEIIRPASGAIVPHNATTVRVTLTYTDPTQAGPTLVLYYHSGTSREYEEAIPTTYAYSPTSSSRDAVYELEVGEGGDGPYALQSQWEFTVVPAQLVGPLRYGAMIDYSLEATVLR